MASVLYALAGKLAGELCSPLFNNYVGKPWELGTKSELEKLINTVSSIQAVLLDAEEKQTTNNQVKDWLLKIKLVFYDLEDLLHEVSYEALKRQVKTKNKKLKKVRIFFSRSNQLKYRFKMGRKVKLIREQLDAIASDSYRFSLARRLEVMPATTRSHRREETHSFVPIEQFIGRVEDKEKVTKLLLESGGLNNVSVISIVGIGGLGKTTLAQSIYNSEEVKCNFEIMLWVCVSDPFDVKLICENIITSVKKKEYKGLPMDVVKDELKKAVDGRKYLLVLDDVWNEYPDEWMKLAVLLSGGANGSKILITTREELVARTAKSIETHVLKGLSLDESWALFKQVAFKQGVEPHSSTIVGIAMEVVERCVGVPLAIKTIASLLGLKEREADWVDFKKNVLPVITQDSEGKIAQILKWSYDNLSAPLKRCFAYCAIFPKDRVIKKDVLIRMWMGQGLIQLDGTSRSLEDVGEQHFMELADRSLFEVDEKNKDGTISRCKMHDLIHDLALSVGGNEFWSNGSDVNCMDVRTRHAWFSNPGPSLSTNLIQAKKLRTLVATNVYSGNMDGVITGDFKQLRVLDFCYIKAARVLEFVSGLRFLTYLNLSGSDFELLPECLCNMYNLQTLILQWCRKLKELPKGTRNLVSLRHLDVSRCDKLSRMPRGLGELTNLQTLSDFVMGPKGADCSELGELKSLINLRGELTIKSSKVGKRRSRGQSCNPTHPLAELQFITRLVLWWKEDEEEEEADEEELRWCREDDVDKNEEEEADEEELRWCREDDVDKNEEEEADEEELRWCREDDVDKNEEEEADEEELQWCREDDVDKNEEEEADELECLKPHPNLESLRLYSYGGKRIPSWMERANIGDSLPNIRSIHFSCCKGLRHLTPLGLLPSLRQLDLWNMGDLEYLYDDKEVDAEGNNNRYFPALEKLLIKYCPLLVVDGKQFMSLREVVFEHDNMETLPGWLLSLPHLQTLRLEYCNNLESLPEWMGDLKSLQEIRLSGCVSLASIPDCVLHLTSLQRLEVWGCRELYRRYNKESGEDWHQISHIPNVSWEMRRRW